MDDWRKGKAFAVKILGGISKWLHDRIFPIILFSIISIIGLEIKKNEQKIKINHCAMCHGVSTSFNGEGTHCATDRCSTCNRI